MLINQLQYSAGRWWGDAGAPVAAPQAQLVIVFGDRTTLERAEYIPGLRSHFGAASIVSCSSGGDILGDRVVEGGLVATAIQFDRARVKAIQEPVRGASDSERCGTALARRLEHDQLRHVLVFSEGLGINGSALASGLSAALPAGVSVTGGLAGDGDRFARTVVGLDAAPVPGSVVAVGLYGSELTIRTGSYGGWEVFGENRTITRSDGNILYELDGRPALDLYKELLGPLGYALPASGLMFPLQISEKEDDERSLIRTILGIDEEARSLTYAGDVPTGWTARLMRTQLDGLIRAAGTAATQAHQANASGETRLALAVSCIGRKLLLQQRVEEELRGVLSVLGEGTQLCGFYSYGEITPTAGFASCDMQNQTMTLTVIAER